MKNKTVKKVLVLSMVAFALIGTVLLSSGSSIDPPWASNNTIVQAKTV